MLSSARRGDGGEVGRVLPNLAQLDALANASVSDGAGRSHLIDAEKLRGMMHAEELTLSSQGRGGTGGWVQDTVFQIRNALLGAEGGGTLPAAEVRVLVVTENFPQSRCLREVYSLLCSQHPPLLCFLNR